jgi:hypothetical protein
MGALINSQKPTYAVGEYPVFVITSAQPGANILWTSYFNNDKTPYEYQLPYGSIGSDGTAHVTWPDPAYKWAIGSWKRVIELENPDGTVDTASVSYTIGASGSAPAPNPTPGQTPPIIPPTPPRSIGPFYPTPITRPGNPILAPPPAPPAPPAPPVTTLPPVSRPPATAPTQPTPPAPAPPDILNPAPVPPRDLYPGGQAPRPPIDRTNPGAPPLVIAPPTDIPIDAPPTNTGQLPPLVPPVPGRTPPDILNPAPVTPGAQPGAQTPGADTSSGFSFTGTFGGVPIWLLVIGAVLVLKGK